MIKLSNATPGCLTIDDQGHRLYCAAREGLLLVFDKRDDGINLVHTLHVSRQPCIGSDFLKQL